MVPIEINHRSGFQTKVYKGSLPSSWDEATAQFWLAFSRWMLDTTTEMKKDAQFNFLYDALPFPPQVLKKINRAVGGDIIKAMPFLFEKIVSSKVAIPEIKVGEDRWYFGDDQLHSMTVWQFISCERLYKMYCDKKEEQYLNQMVAILYRKIGSDGLIPVFAEREVVLRVPQVVKHVPLDEKRTVLLNFIAMMNYLSVHPDLRILFPKQSTETTMDMLTQDSSSANDWSKIILEMSGPQLGTVSEVESLPTFYFMKTLADRTKQLKRKRKSHSNGNGLEIKV